MSEAKLCRFCLDTKNRKLNPLINPCRCKGSMEFVHVKCLNRWRLMDFERNGKTCSLCLTEYVFPRMFEYETIPAVNTIPFYFLQYPGLILASYNYIYVVLISSTKSFHQRIVYEFFYFLSQYCFVILYAVFFHSKWRVVNQTSYWNQVKTIWTPVFVGLHMFLFSLLQDNLFTIGPLLSFYLGIYWKAHITFLQNINENLTMLENQL